MFLRPLSLLALLLSASLLRAQTNTQTVRGTVLDGDTHQPVPGATVALSGPAPAHAATTDADGRFRLEQVPVGRTDLHVRAIGYDDITLADLLVTSAKELVLEVKLQEALARLKEAVVTAQRPKGEVRNDMATVSARSIRVEETGRIAGGINDPARMVGTFPGVAGDPSGNNTIVVRGNSPKGVLWRLEGVEIPNPNHFADDGSTGGPINVLNSDMIDDSEFYTGAFGAEYGNVTSAVFDMRLRTGNDRKREYTLKAGVLGTDLTAEGPLPGVDGASYLMNYRYSTLALLDKAGIVDYKGVPEYTDAAFNVKTPTRAGTFTLFGVGGRSRIAQVDDGTTGDTVFARNRYNARMGVLGLTHTRTLGANSFLYSTVSLSGSGSGNTFFEAPVPGESELVQRGDVDLAKWTARASTTLNMRINARHKLRAGLILSNAHFHLFDDRWDYPTARMVNVLDRSGSANTVQAFASWKWRWSERWSAIGGVHALYYDLNEALRVEPRLAVRYQVTPDQAFTLGAGLHSTTPGLMTSLVQRADSMGRTTLPNRALGLTHATHLVVGYERSLGPDVRLKAEAYYQFLSDVPVENDPHSTYSESNAVEWFTDRPLVNKGTGYNRGVELSLEKYFTHGYHYLVTASFSDSRYRALDGVWHHARFDLGTVLNVVAGKEWKLGATKAKDRTLLTGFRYSMQGGQYRTPIDLQASIASGTEQEGTPPWSIKGGAVHKLDLVISYRVGRPKVSHEFKLDVQNVLSADTTVADYFDRRTGTIKHVPQLPPLPVLQYTLRF